MKSMVRSNTERHKAWYIRYPGDFYALGPIRFPRIVNERDVRDYMRNCDKVARLPRGFETWPTDD